MRRIAPRRTSPNDNNDVERDFECNEPPEERFPLSTNRRLGFTGLLDMIEFDRKRSFKKNYHTKSIKRINGHNTKSSNLYTKDKEQLLLTKKPTKKSIYFYFF